MIKYYTGGWSKKIEVVEVERETESSVWVKHTVRKSVGDKMELRRRDKKDFHDTWGDAKDHLLENATRDVENARATLNHYLDVVGNIKGMKEPADAAQ